MDKGSLVGRTIAAPVEFSFDVALKLTPEGDHILHQPLEPADQLDLYSEVWLEQMRRGQPGLALEDLLLRTLPVGAREDRIRCEGLLVEATSPSGETVSRRFGLDALSHVALRGAASLVQSGDLQPDQNYYYELIVRRAAVDCGVPESASDVGGSFAVQHPPLDYLEYPLPSLLAQSDAVGPVGGWCPVIYSHDVFLRASRSSRRGASKEPPEESGAVILGLPCSCPETGEFFLVATDIIELEETTQSTYSLAFSARTWSRIQAEVEKQQARTSTRALRLLGLSHGHNFFPCMLQGTDCRSCEKRENCGLTSVFISDQDQIWTRSVFVRQPWTVSHVFGLDSTGAQVHCLYGIQGGRMIERGFHLTPEIPDQLKGGGVGSLSSGSGANKREDT
jgi:hypothetical protein